MSPATWRGLDVQFLAELQVFDASTKMVVDNGTSTLFLGQVARWEFIQEIVLNIFTLMDDLGSSYGEMRCWSIVRSWISNERNVWWPFRSMRSSQDPRHSAHGRDTLI